MSAVIIAFPHPFAKPKHDRPRKRKAAAVVSLTPADPVEELRSRLVEGTCAWAEFYHHRQMPLATMQTAMTKLRDAIALWQASTREDGPPAA